MTDEHVPEESAQDLFENAPFGYLSTLPDGRIIKVNETFLTWTGHRAEDIVGRRRFQDLLTAGGRIYHETHFAPLLRMQERSVRSRWRSSARMAGGCRFWSTRC
jgi:phosphoserine phosphatase RsbU/P